MNGNEVVDTDLLIIGSECAGARAAIEARKHGIKVIMVTKGIIAKSGATLTVSSLNSDNGLDELLWGFEICITPIREIYCPPWKLVPQRCHIMSSDKTRTCKAPATGNRNHYFWLILPRQTEGPR